MEASGEQRPTLREEPFPGPAPGAAGKAHPSVAPPPRPFLPSLSLSLSLPPAPGLSRTPPGLPGRPRPGGGCTSSFHQRPGPQWDVADAGCWEPPAQGQHCPSMGTALHGGTRPLPPGNLFSPLPAGPPPQRRGPPASPMCTAPILGEQRSWGRGAPQTGPHRLCCVLRPHTHWSCPGHSRGTDRPRLGTNPE